MSGASATAPVSGRELRPEIQALRAAAVLGVVVFHLWPARLPGGYAGVDVFFAISGFLITAHLLRELEASGRISLSRFYARRIRRLLPAAMLVLAVSLVGVLALSPEGQRRDFAIEIGASAVYVVNWVLAANAVDYFAVEQDASPVQHYWSLSVEEQFYLVWPVLLVLATLLAGAALRRRRAAWAIAIGLVAVGGLVASVLMTEASPSFAYFATPTHAWEFALGGLLALAGGRVLGRAGPRLRGVLSWIGLAAILAAFLLFTGETPFPGWVALLPVGGAVLVIAAGAPDSRLAPTRLMRLRPVAFLGDVSYSLYLWHWPLIVFAPALLGREPGLLEKLGLLLASVLLAWLTRVAVERPVIRGRVWSLRRMSFGLAAVTSLALLAGCVAVVSDVDRRAAAAQAQLEEELEAAATPTPSADHEAPPRSCLGAAALPAPEDCEYRLAVDPAIGADPDGLVLPPLDGGDVAGAAPVVHECEELGDQETRCTIGSTEPDAVLAVVGDSHAEMYLPALTGLLAERNWQIRSYTKRSCPAIDAGWTAPDDVTYKENSPACRDWRDEVLGLVAADEEIGAVAVASYTRRWGKTADAADRRALVDALADTWGGLAAAGKGVVVLGDAPVTATGRVQRCIAEGDPADDCSLARAAALAADPALESVAGLQADRVLAFDPADGFCDAARCYVVAGGLVAYLDSHHLTEAYARTLAPLLAPLVDEAMA
ncbi:acyltransferase family protein [Homoserinibacter sp. YIM 151385]|uniref:acyltransferase family protein n=1 Tax=Homoserinibacter sp. YIM 151385 TaxID=2985506 RepID=UPI0022F0E6D4|nr:acyltransferase family protein [Homoserinibacter sp. YIM 151385]WBU37767.1 acyltransferase family protein [Homoserinibacter sp. YIM 151385]